METTRARMRRIMDGFFKEFIHGRGIDIGCGIDPLTYDCVRYDKRDGDATTLLGIPKESFDWVYSSHCLEHLDRPAVALTRWWEVLKVGGHLIVYVPDYELFEVAHQPLRPDKRELMRGHKWGYSLDDNDSPKVLNLRTLVDKTCSGSQIAYARRHSQQWVGWSIEEVEPPGECSIELVARKGIPVDDKWRSVRTPIGGRNEDD